MHLWTEYEGRTIDETYYLESLLRSEGRNAFFKTHSQAQKDAVIRLTEAHFDEEETLERWRHIAAVEQDNLIEIGQVGRTTYDGIALTYAVLEPSDANLAEVLQERPLTTSETIEVARAIVSALSALHRNGFAHEHIEPTNVLAVGETVKLRSDCVHECAPDMEFSTSEDCEELRRRDIHDFGVLLLQCLTLSKECASTSKLAKPFDQLIPGALNGTLTLAQMASVLEPAPIPSTSIPATAIRSDVTISAPSTSPSTPGGMPPEKISPVASARLVPKGVIQERPVLAVPQVSAVKEEVLTAQSPLFSARNNVGVVEDTRWTFGKAWVFYLAGIILIALIGLHFFGRSPKPATNPAALSKPVAQQQTALPNTPAPVPTTPASGTAKAGWYVVAFTYNHEEQAKAKVALLRKKHFSLHPQVFTPSGHAPYLVTLGGPMSDQAAVQTLKHARRSGMPRDTYVQNY